MPDRVRVFVSHSHHDNAWCREFVGVLQAAGWDVWYDEKGLGAGAEWVATIQREVQARDIFLLILTPDAWDSRWVQEELNLALATHKRIIPVMHLQTQVGGFLLTRQWVEVVGMSGPEAARTVADVLGQAGEPPASSSMPAPAPAGATPAFHLTPMSLYTLNFRGYAVNGIECVLPPVCLIPDGVFIMGSDKARDTNAMDKELPQYPVQVGDFSIGKHPVTVAEYACAVGAKAVREPPMAFKAPLGIEWSTQLQRPNHPVVCVSWQDAVAYVRWLARVTGQPWRLPTEAEWEKAARGTDARIYPWGDVFDKTKGNTSESGIGGTTPVGTYPGGASPYQAQDMAGNVYQWTSSLYKSYAYTPNDGREDLNSAGNRVLRGGSWGSLSLLARAAYRGDSPAGHFVEQYGFRLAWSVAGS